MRLNTGISAILAAVAVSLAACGGGKVVVVPPFAPAVASAPVIPAPAVVVTVPATPPPPATEASVASVSPGSDYVWVQGYYNWDVRLQGC